MTFQPICRALVAFAVLLLALPTWSSAAEPPPSPERGVVDVRALVKEGRFQEALAILRPLARAHPDRKEFLFLIGLSAIESSRRPGMPEADRVALLDEAITALRSMLIDQPGLVRVRLELARAFFYKREEGLSREHFERVMAGNPPPPVVANVRRFLSQIRARRRWNIHLGFAVAPDTNIGGTSNERTIYIFGLPFRRDAESLTTSGIGLSLWGGGEYQHPLGRSCPAPSGGGRLAEGSTRAGGSIGWWCPWHAGPRVFVSRTTEFSVLGNWRHQWSANDPD